MTRALALLLAAAALSGCGEPRHLQYDFGRSYTAAFTAQTDRTRPSVSDAVYELEGLEAFDIRLRARESATEEESGESELSAEAMR